MQETQVRSLGQEDALEKEMALTPSCLGNSMDRGAWRASVYGVKKSQTHTYNGFLPNYKKDGCESWTVKKAERRKIDAFELWCLRRLLSPLDCKEIQPVHPKGDKSWMFIGRTDAEAETPILRPPHAES